MHSFCCSRCSKAIGRPGVLGGLGFCDPVFFRPRQAAGWPVSWDFSPLWMLMPRRLIRDGAETAAPPREQQEAEHERLGEVQGKARERLTQLLQCLARRDLQLQGGWRLCAHFRQHQYRDAVRLRPVRISRQPEFLAGARPPRRSSTRGGRGRGSVQERQARARIPLSPQRWLLLLGERRTARDPRRERRARRDRWLVERHHGAKTGGRRRGRGARTPFHLARKRAGRDL